MQIIGFQEFAYSDSDKRKLIGEDREVEREYWLEMLVNVESVSFLQGNSFIILHVHYAGKYLEDSTKRDRSVIKQINVRHTGKPLKGKKYAYLKCKDLNTWREQWGTEVKGIPKNGWKWKDDPSISKAVHKVLTMAEECTRMVRSISLGLDMQDIGKPQRKALICAVSDYEHISPLPNAHFDGAKLGALLMKFGWKVTFVPDTSLDGISKKLEEWVSTLGKEACLFAFVGHGVECYNGEQFFVPKDAQSEKLKGKGAVLEQNLNKTCLPFLHVQKMLWQAHTELGGKFPPSIFIFDCCREKTRDIGLAPPKQVQGDLPNAFICYSTSKGDVAKEGTAGHGGAFMNEFVKAAENSPESRINDVLSETRDGVYANDYQLATEYSTLFKPFYLNPEASTPATPSRNSLVVSTPVTPSRTVGDIIKNESARTFWTTSFGDTDKVSSQTFKHALVQEQELEFVRKEGNFELILKELDHDDDNHISAIEFNVFTMKKGLEGACRVACSGVQSPTRASETAPIVNQPSAKSMQSFETDDVWKKIGSLFTQGALPVDYTGKGSFLGGAKNRRGQLGVYATGQTVFLRLLKVPNSDGIKFDSDVTKCQVAKTDGVSVDVSESGKLHQIRFNTETAMNQFTDGIKELQSILESGDAHSKERYADSKNLIALGGCQMMFAEGRNNTGPGFVLAQSPLREHQSFFEILVRQSGRIGLGLCSGKTRSFGNRGEVMMPGCLPGEIGYHHGRIWEGNTQGKSFGFCDNFSAGDRVGCGLFFSKGQAAKVYFTLNSNIVGIRQVHGENIPIVGMDGCGNPRADILLDSPALDPTTVQNFCRRITVGGENGQVSAYFSDLAEAVRHAVNGQCITLSPDTYLVNETLLVDKEITIQCTAGAGEATLQAAMECKDFILELQEKCSFKNITLQGHFGCSALKVLKGGHIEKCKLLTKGGVERDVGGCGIISYSRSALQVSNCVIGPCQISGIALHNVECKLDPGYFFHKTEFVKCVEVGVKLMHSGVEATFDECTFRECGLAIHCTNSINLTVRKSDIAGTGKGRERTKNCTGIYLQNSSEANILGCKFYNHFKAIQLDSSKLQGEEESTIESCQGSCIYADGKTTKITKLISWKFSKCGLERANNCLYAGITAVNGASAYLEKCRFTECNTSALLSGEGAIIMHGSSEFVSNVKDTREMDGGQIRG